MEGWWKRGNTEPSATSAKRERGVGHRTGRGYFFLTSHAAATDPLRLARSRLAGRRPTRATSTTRRAKTRVAHLPDTIERNVPKVVRSNPTESEERRARVFLRASLPAYCRCVRANIEFVKFLGLPGGCPRASRVIARRVVTSATSVVAPATDGRAARVYRGVACDGGGGAGAGASRRGGVVSRGDGVDGVEIERGILARRARGAGGACVGRVLPRAREAHGWTAGARARARTRAATRASAPHRRDAVPVRVVTVPDLMATAAPGARGPVGWRSLAIMAVTGGGLLYYFERERARRVDAIKEGPGAGKAAIGGPFELRNANADGARFRTSDLHGKYALLYFGFTMCPDICPDELEKMAEAVNLVEKAGQEIVPVFVSIDPERDTSNA